MNTTSTPRPDAPVSSLRKQRTIARSACLSGVGFFTDADVTVEFQPANPHEGIVFERIDCAGSPSIPARLEFAIERERRTVLEQDGVSVELTEHVLAALAGLQIDNCRVLINAPELPGGDGSSLCFVECLDKAGAVEQDAARACLTITDDCVVQSDDANNEIAALATLNDALTISYRLDYGIVSPISPQQFALEITPESFVRELAWSRTFVLESEVAALQAAGYGKRTIAKDLLVFGENGVVDNELRAHDECARHKILDCLGDFALLGCDLVGRIEANRSGHAQNRELIRRISGNDSGQHSEVNSRAA
jgi:UDP-3-O-acyl N-acetylglucosamine deacetylase